MTHTRRFETKLGERLQAICDASNLEASLITSAARFVLVGIPEDIGVKANYGVGGTETVWKPFLDRFVNIQSNDFLEGDEILLLGHFDFTEISSLIEGNATVLKKKLMRTAMP